MKAPCLNWSGPTLFSCIVAQSKGPKPSRSGCSEPEKDTEPARPLKRRRASRSNTCCEFLGKLVCKHALRCLYGIGSGTVNKIYKGEKALHYGQGRKHPKHPQLGYALRDSTRTKWPSVVMYFWLLYHNVAEVLPERFEMPKFATGEDFEDDLAHEDPDGAQRHLQSFLLGLDRSLYNPDTSNMGPGTLKGPRRFVQVSSASQLYWDYSGFEMAAGRTPAGLTAFTTCFKKMFKTHLGMRKRGTHALCNMCSRLKSEGRKATTQERKAEIQQIYANHLLAQWLDRQYYWQMRALAAACFRNSMEFSQKLHGFNLSFTFRRTWL